MTYVNKNLFESPFNQDILQICGLEELANVGASDVCSCNPSF